jgi:trigger factor
VAEGVESNGTFGTEIVADKKTSKALMGMKVGDNLVIDINKAFEKDFNAANAFGLTEDQIKNSTGLFDFTVNEISKVEAAEINQELFDKVFGEGQIANEKEFRARIKTEAEQMFVGESDRQFLNDIRKVVLEKSKFDLPNEFLKKWMLTSPEREVTAEQVEKEYPEMKDSMKWQLVENKIVKDEKIEVTQEELIDYTKQLVVRQMMQYGQQPPADQLENIAKSVLENKEEGQRVTDQLFSEKLLAYYKNTVKLQEKETTFDDFVKLINK